MSKKNLKQNSIEKAKSIIADKCGIIRTAEALAVGIHPHTLYAMRDNGILEKISRGVYRLADMKPVSNPDLVTVALRIPRATVCLTSALAYHGSTTQIPHEVSIALEKGAEEPRIDYPSIRVYRFSGDSLSAGREVVTIDGIEIHIYNIEKTIADCFKFRNKLGMDIVLEALKLYKERKRLYVDKILSYARICRVEQKITPYLEAL